MPPENTDTHIVTTIFGHLIATGHDGIGQDESESVATWIGAISNAIETEDSAGLRILREIWPSDCADLRAGYDAESTGARPCPRWTALQSGHALCAAVEVGRELVQDCAAAIFRRYVSAAVVAANR